MSEPTVTPEQATLPEAHELAPAEYRQHREEGKTVAEIVKARPEPSPDATGTTEAASTTGRARDEAGRFAKKEEPAAPVAETTKPTAGNPRHDPKARVEELKTEIAALSKQKGETQRERDAIAAELTSLRAERDALKTPPKAEAATPPAADTFTYPSYEQWAEKHADGNYEDYLAARVRAEIKHENKLEADAKAQTEAQAQYAEAWKPFHEREAAFKATTPDYDAVIQRSPAAEIPLGPWVLEILQTDEKGPALRYYLAQHPDETREIASLRPAAAVRKLDALLTSLAAASTGTAPATPPQTKADPPFEPVGASASASTRSLETAAASGDMARYRELREAGARR